MYSNELVINILNYIDTHLNAIITIEELSKTFSYDKFYIMKRFKKELKISIFNYINILKIYKSLPYIKDNSILKTSILSGFNSIEYYSEIFKKVMKITPSTYKKYISKRYISDKNLITLQTSLLKINQLLNIIKEYRNNIKPNTLPTLKLSINKK